MSTYDSLRKIRERATLGLKEADELPIGQAANMLRVHYESILSIAIDEMRKIELMEDSEETNRLYQR
ncbi:MAG: hypothetical protein SFU99_03975 [Saprospiraceae bacterium]|nr:hypothetical protein [Saprospiraceae bacterium]